MEHLPPHALGKLPPRHDPRTLQLAHYLGAALPEAPTRVSWVSQIPTWPMLANDRVGCCAFASAGHLIHVWTHNADGSKRAAVLHDDDILTAYSGATGYDPRHPETDRGTVMLDALRYWQKTGIGHHKIAAYAAIEPLNKTHVRLALAHLGGLHIGLALPLSAQGQRVWSVPSGASHDPRTRPNSWGGHAATVVGFDPLGLTIVTWGALQRMTWSFWETFCDEAYVAISDDWIADAGKTPSGLDLAGLRADLVTLRKGRP